MIFLNNFKKTNFTFFVFIFFSILSLSAQNDTMFVMKNGNVVAKYNINNEIDSIVFVRSTTPINDFFVDERDSNVYHTVTIGTQIWMSENLRYLPYVIGNNWTSSTIPMYHVYGYYGTSVIDAKATTNYNTYGVLYNWPAAMTSYSISNSNSTEIKGVCPTGWHLPSDLEWSELGTYLGGDSIAGGKLKEAGTVHWASPNTGATNETNFNGLPGGSLMPITYAFEGLRGNGYFWSSTEANATGAWYRALISYSSILTKYSYPVSKNMAMSIRCIKN